MMVEISDDGGGGGGLVLETAKVMTMMTAPYTYITKRKSAIG